MRKIKFRAWDKENEKMMKVSSLHLENKEISVKENGTFRLFRMQDLMQYTGLKDKNGKEIYEGDVVKLVHFKDGRKKETGKVIFLHSQAGFGIIDRDGNEYPLFRNTAKQIEIIENIQENKR